MKYKNIIWIGVYIMLKVLKVVRDSSKLYMLYFKDSVPLEKRVMKEFNPDLLLKCDVSVDSDLFENIEEYDTSSIIHGECNKLVLLKDYLPDLCFHSEPLYDKLVLDVDNWVMYNNIPVCQLYDLSGNWSGENGIYVLSNVHPVRVMRYGYKRHREDKEGRRLVINIKQGVQKIEGIEYKGSMRIVYDEIYNFDARCWQRIVKSEEDIISVKRD